MAQPGHVVALSRAGSPGSQHARVRWLAATLFLGPVFVVIWLLLPHGEVSSLAGVIAMAASAFALGIVLVLVPSERIPDVALKCCLFLTTAVISAGVVFGGASGSVFALFYLWAVPYAFAYFSGRDGVIHTAFVAACYAGVLAIQRHAGVADVQHPISRWVMLIGSLGVVGTLVRELTRWGRDSDARFRRGFDDSQVPMALVTLDGHAMEVNDALCRLVGRERQEIEGRRAGMLVHAEDLGINRAAFARIVRSDAAFERFDSRVVRRDGAPVLASVTASVVRDQHGGPQYFFVQIQDVTAERRAMDELRRRGLQQQAIARLGQLALSERDPVAFMQHLAETVAETLGVERTSVLELEAAGAEFQVAAGVGWPEGVVGIMRVPSTENSPAGHALRSRTQVVVDDVLADARFEIPEIVRALGIRSGVAVVVDGHEAPFGVLVVYASQLRSFDTDDVAFVQAAANVLSSAVDRRRSDDANRFAALHDPLTGLANRTLALDRLQLALARRGRERTSVAVLVLDLDRFKVINDSLGHDVGDELLLQLAPRLCEAVRPTDTVARLGGDEFLVVCEAIDGPHEAMVVAERLASAVAAPLTLQSGEHFLSASIGLAVSSTVGDTADTPDTPDTLVRDADAAMYRAKDAGRGRCELFDEGMRKRVLSRLRVETELRSAIRRGALRVHYQPVVDAFTGRPEAVEALVRWEHDERGLLGPAEFIGVAEETGLITQLGRFVLEAATAQVAVWQRTHGPLELCVNVSGRQLANPQFPAEVAAIVRRSGMLPGTLGLEITESVLIEEAGSSVRVLNALQEQGLRLLLDDFGTGYSSLSYLKNFPLDALKLDRSFVEGLGVHAGDTAIVEAIMRMAHAVDMSVVAEGVETDDQLATLRRLGCGRAQGFLFAAPMTASDCAAYLAARRGAAVA